MLKLLCSSHYPDSRLLLGTVSASHLAAAFALRAALDLLFLAFLALSLRHEFRMRAACVGGGSFFCLGAGCLGVWGGGMAVPGACLWSAAMWDAHFIMSVAR